MRSFLSLLFWLIAWMTSAQEANSLLWEISGNGLEKSSYLYGTMHVSKKIAFRLDDVFYEALDQSEMVALESDPNLWLEKNDAMANDVYGNGAGFVTKGFYARSFRVDNPRKEVLGAYLAYEDRIVNGILYRTNEFSQNFEEETYLDMFIYQAGQKFDKPIIALEDLEESATLVGRASLNAMKRKPDEWLQKKMQQQDPMFLLQDAYRERNIALLDSIDRAIYTEHYLKNMLHIRNANMTERLDSIMHQGKVFAGIGAAHLPGEQGVLRLLQKKGYTVRPLTSQYSSKGQRIKMKLEQKKRINQYQRSGPKDGFFSLKLPNKLYPISDRGKTTYVSPDLANGSFVVINRIPRYAYLKKDVDLSLEAIDKLLFENIPGKIIEKKSIETDGFNGLDIKNQLKNGDYQRYHIYNTPLEIVVIKMGGEGDYVAQVSDSIFNSLKFKSQGNNKVWVSSDFRDFEVQFPSLYNFTNPSRSGDRRIEGYEPGSDTYYFLQKSVLNDFDFIESDTFELKQIQKRFYQDFNLKPKYDSFDGKKLTSSAVFDTLTNKRLYLMTTIRRGEYYLLGTLSSNKKESEAFFKSFRLKESEYAESFQKIGDTALYFSTRSTLKPPKFVESSNSYFTGAPRTNDNDPFYKKTVYRNNNDEAISVEVNKSHDFLMFKNLDSLWALRKRLYANKKFNVIRETKTSSPKGYHELQLTLTDTASTRGILIKNIVKDGLLYELKTIVDTLHGQSKFITEFYDNFEPKDTVIGKDMLTDKVPEFFQALQRNDSIVLDGHRFLKFEERHADSLKYYISELDFDGPMRRVQSYLLQQLGQLKNTDVKDFYKEFYALSYNNSAAQALILQAIANDADENSVDLLLALMGTDIPLLSNTFEISLIFRPYRENLILAKKLFPKLLDYSAIAEYKAPIFSLLAKLETHGILQPKIYKKYKVQIVNDAKIQLKRQLGREAVASSPDGRASQLSQVQYGVLEDYISLLFPFRKEKNVRVFFEKLALVEHPKIRTSYVSLLARNSEPLPQEELLSLAENSSSRLLLYEQLEEVGHLDKFPHKYATQKAMAAALLFESSSFSGGPNDVEFLEEKPIDYNGKKMTGYYFKKRNNDDYDKNFYMYLLVFDNGKGLQTKPFYANEGLRIEDTDTDAEVIDLVTEEFLLKDRKRAQAYRPNGYGGYGY